MFKRALLQQTRQISTRNLVAATQPCLKLRGTQSSYPAAIRLARRAYSSTTEAEKPAAETASETEKLAEEIKNESSELSNIAKELEAVQKELGKKTEEARDFKDKFTRAVAEFRNLQDRAERDKKSAREFAIQKFAKDLCDSVDNLDRALGAVPEETRADSTRNKELVDLYNGLRMTEEILLGTMKKHGLEKIDPLGETFDPNLHEATFQAPMPDKEPGSVFHVQQTGFTLNGRTIRAAKVGVVAQPPK